MSTRDELAEKIHAEICDEYLDEHLDPDWPGRCVKAADAILAAGYVKADREEWGVSWQPEGHIEPMDSRAEARDAIDRLVFGDRVRRLVGPWEVA